MKYNIGDKFVCISVGIKPCHLGHDEDDNKIAKEYLHFGQVLTLKDFMVLRGGFDYLFFEKIPFGYNSHLFVELYPTKKVTPEVEELLTSLRKRYE